MKIFYIVGNQGDGSSSVEFYDSQECIDYLLDEETCPDFERYMDGDGGSYGSFEAPAGIQFSSKWQKVETLEDIKTENE